MKGVQEYKEETLKAKPYKRQLEELSLYKRQKQQEESYFTQEIKIYQKEIEEIEKQVVSLK